MLPGRRKVTDSRIAEKIGEACESCEGSRRQTCSEQPGGSGHPDGITRLPERDVAQQSGDEEGDRKRYEHWMNRVAEDVSRADGICHGDLSLLHRWGLRPSRWMTVRVSRRQRSPSNGKVSLSAGANCS